jgi:hypothetical protein
MKHRNSHFAIGYWSRLRQGRRAPDQADIDPKALKRLLPFVFLLDARPDGSFVYRLAGTTLCDRYGTELRGRNFVAHWDAESRNRLSEAMRQSLAAPTPLCLTSIGATEDCRMVEIETVLMPITFGSETPERFLGVAQLLSDSAALLGRSVTFERLAAAALVREDDGTLASDDLPPPADGPGWRSHPKAPHLRLVVSRPDAPRPDTVGGGKVARDPLHFDASEALQKILSLCTRVGARR